MQLQIGKPKRSTRNMMLGKINQGEVRDAS
jgi:hypothetical protein